MIPTRIQTHLRPLYMVLYKLENKLEDSNFWYELDSSLRVYLRLDNPEIQEEDALNRLLLEMQRKPKKFTPIKNDPDSFIQCASLVRMAYNNHKLKTQRPEISQEIKILTYVLDEQGRLTEKDQKRLDYLYKLRKKI